MAELPDGSTGFRNRAQVGPIIVKQTGQGIFVYDGTPALGNLIVAIAGSNGTDPYGNVYFKGIGIYNGADSYILENVVSGFPVITLNPNRPVYDGGEINARDDDLIHGGTPSIVFQSPSVTSIAGAISTIQMSGESTDQLVPPWVRVVGDLITDPSLTPLRMYATGIGMEAVSFATLQNAMHSTTLIVDDELVFDMDANASYIVEVYALFQTASVTCDLKTDWNPPAGSTGLKQCLGATLTAGGFTSRDQTQMRVGGHGLGTDIVYQLGSTAADQLVWEKGIVHTINSGPFQFRFAQSVLDAANDVTRDANSFMSVKQVR